MPFADKISNGNYRKEELIKFLTEFVHPDCTVAILGNKIRVVGAIDFKDALTSGYEIWQYKQNNWQRTR